MRAERHMRSHRRRENVAARRRRASSDEFLSVSPCARQSVAAVRGHKSQNVASPRARVPRFASACDGYRALLKLKRCMGLGTLLSDGDRDARAPHSGVQPTRLPAGRRTHHADTQAQSPKSVAQAPLGDLAIGELHSDHRRTVA